MIPWCYENRTPSDPTVWPYCRKRVRWPLLRSLDFLFLQDNEHRWWQIDRAPWPISRSFGRIGPIFVQRLDSMDLSLMLYPSKWEKFGSWVAAVQENDFTTVVLKDFQNNFCESFYCFLGGIDQAARFTFLDRKSISDKSMLATDQPSGRRGPILPQHLIYIPFLFLHFWLEYLWLEYLSRSPGQ